MLEAADIAGNVQYNPAFWPQFCEAQGLQLLTDSQVLLDARVVMRNSGLFKFGVRGVVGADAAQSAVVVGIGLAVSESGTDL